MVHERRFDFDHIADDLVLVSVPATCPIARSIKVVGFGTLGDLPLGQRRRWLAIFVEVGDTRLGTIRIAIDLIRRNRVVVEIAHECAASKAWALEVQLERFAARVIFTFGLAACEVLGRGPFLVLCDIVLGVAVDLGSRQLGSSRVDTDVGVRTWANRTCSSRIRLSGCCKCESREGRQREEECLHLDVDDMDSDDQMRNLSRRLAILLYSRLTPFAYSYGCTGWRHQNETQDHVDGAVLAPSKWGYFGINILEQIGEICAAAKTRLIPGTEFQK